MAVISKIEWTDMSWNPVTGCTKISQGCKNCYAERMANRLMAMHKGKGRYANGFKVTTHENALGIPRKVKTPKYVFVNSMSDLFHEDVPIEFIQQVFGVMRDVNWHTYQVLTKRAGRLLEVNGDLEWADHIWMGVSVEDQQNTDRIQLLSETNASVKFLSVEPLIGQIHDLNLDAIDWVIVGGESGPRARPIETEWVRRIRDQCVEEGVAFFFKQWGGVRKHENGRILDGRTWDEMPDAHAKSGVL